MPAYSPFRIEIRSPDRTHRRRFPTQQFVSASWARERYGGYGAFTLVTAAPVKGGLPTIQKGDQVEFWYKGQRRYRGVVQARRPSKEDVEKLSIEGAGVSAALAKQLYAPDPGEGVYYAYPGGGGKDASVAFGDIGKDFLLPATAPGGLPLIEVVQASPIGTLITTLDGRKKLSGDILNDWVTQTGNLAAWGCDVDSFGRNRAYGRPITLLSAPADWVIPVPGANVETSQAELQSADIVNCGLFVGDNAQYPQMLANGNFALPTFYQEGAGNVITDGDFEARSGWTLAGGASFKGTGGVEGDPFSGSVMVECDHVGESVSKSGPFAGAVAGHNYTFGIRAKKEVAAQIADGHATCQIKDGAGSVIQTFSLVVAPLGTAWDYFSQTQALLPGAASWSVVAQADHIQGVGSDQGGLLLDALELFDSDVAYQTGFQALGYGTGQVVALNWLYQDTAYTGKYCVYLQVNVQDLDAHDAHLEPLGQAPFAVSTKQGLRYGLWFRSPVVQTPGLGLPKFFLDIEWRRSDGTSAGRSRQIVNAQAANAAWQYAENVAGAPQGATKAYVTVVLRTPGEILLDALSVRDSAAPAAEGVPVSQYVPEGPLTTFLRADDASLALPAAAQASINANGTLAGINQVGSLIRLGDLRAVGVASLSTTALEARRPDLTLLGDQRVFWPGQSVRLAGTDGPSLAPTTLSIARVQESLDAADMILRTGLHVEKPQPSDILTTKKLIQIELNKRLIPGAGTSSAAGGAGAGGGGGATTPVTLQTITKSATDPTTHDQVRTGPHVSDQEHTDLAATKAEVVAARTRTVKGLSYTTTEGRLDAMEIDIARSGLPSGTADGQTLRWVAATSAYVADPNVVDNGTGTLTITAASGNNTGLTLTNQGAGNNDLPAVLLNSHDAATTVFTTNHGHPLGCIAGFFTTATDGFVVLASDGSKVLFAGQNKRVGIKTTIPRFDLEVGGDACVTGVGVFADVAATHIMYVGGGTGLLANAAAGDGYLRCDTGDVHLAAHYSGGSSDLQITATQIVGRKPFAGPHSAADGTAGVSGTSGGGDTLKNGLVVGLGNEATLRANAVAAEATARANGDAASALKAANLSDLASAATARTNLGLGTAAVANLPAAGSNASSVQAVRGDDTRLGSTGAAARATATVISMVLASHAIDNSHTLTLGKSGLVLQMATDVPAWIRMYDSQAALAADAARPGPWAVGYAGPTAGMGVLLEVVTTAAMLTIPFSPVAGYANLDATGGVPNNTYFLAIGNASGTSQTVTVTMTHLPIEN